MKLQSFTKIWVVVVLCCMLTTGIAQSVTINPNGTSAIIDAQSTSKGALLPRMTLAQRNALTLSTGLQVYCSDCTPAGPYSYNGTSWIAMFQTSTAGGVTYTVGQTAQGGKIFWVDETGQHGLVAATTDQSLNSVWFNGNYLNTKAVRVGVYGGATNTELINVNQGAGNYASVVAAQYAGGQFGDWYLPSITELNLMYAQRAIIGGFDTSAFYWSSTEYLVSSGNVSDSAYQIDFSTGSQSTALKNIGNKVRAIRRF